MKLIVEKRNYIILFIIIFLLIWIVFSNKKAYVETFNFNGIPITYVIYDKVNSDEISKNIDEIYEIYRKKTLDEKGTKYILNHTDGYFDETEKYLACFSTDEVLKYFKHIGISRYMVNIDGDVILGDNYSNNKYSVSIHDPSDNSILKILYFNDKALSSITSNDKMNNLKGIRKDYDMVSVLCDDIVTSNVISNYIYFLSIKEGKKVLSKNNCEGLWYQKGEIYTSENFSKYFNKML